MKLPNQTKGVKRKTYDANAVTTGANASFWGSLLSNIAKVGGPMLKAGLGAL